MLHTFQLNAILPRAKDKTFFIVLETCIQEHVFSLFYDLIQLQCWPNPRQLWVAHNIKIIQIEQNK